MNNKEVAKAFAEGKQEASAEHLFINGGVIYSYGGHFPLAMWLDYPNVVLVNDDRYSNTTSRHKSLVISAILNINRMVEIVGVSTQQFKEELEVMG